jgi:hypothetical protein
MGRVWGELNMEFIFEIIFQFLGEILLQVFIEGLFEIGLHSLANVFEQPKNKLLSSIGYCLWGAIAGGLSLLIFSTSFIHSPDLKLANLFITPILIGGCMMVVGKIRTAKGDAIIGLDTFLYGFLFAFSMSLVRYMWAA